jgi:hypothetical protein
VAVFQSQLQAPGFGASWLAFPNWEAICELHHIKHCGHEYREIENMNVRLEANLPEHIKLLGSCFSV